MWQARQPTLSVEDIVFPCRLTSERFSPCSPIKSLSGMGTGESVADIFPPLVFPANKLLLCLINIFQPVTGGRG